MKLYYFQRSHHSRRVLAALNHLGMAVDLEHRDLVKGEHHTPELQAINPGGMLPLLVDGDFVLSESNAIMMYLADKHGPTSLYPQEMQARARMHQWLSWQMCHFGPATSPFVFEHIVKPLIGGGPVDEARLAKAREDFLRFGKILDAQVATGSFVAGSEVTLADFAIASNLMYAGPAKMPLADLPNAMRWYARIEALPAWQASAAKTA